MKKLKRISQYQMDKMKSSCDEKTIYPLTCPSVIYIIKINQSEWSPLLSRTRNQPISVRHFWAIIPICGLIITYMWHSVMYLWPTCELTSDPLVAILSLTCNCIHMKLFWKLCKIFFKIRWNFFSNWVKFSKNLSEIFWKTVWYSFKSCVILS